MINILEKSTELFNYTFSPAAIFFHIGINKQDDTALDMTKLLSIILVTLRKICLSYNQANDKRMMKYHTKLTNHQRISNLNPVIDKLPKKY